MSRPRQRERARPDGKMPEIPMVALSERSTAERWIGAVVEPGFARANPARRGPVVLAIDGTECDKSAVVSARMIAARLNLPLEVITVLEPTPTSSATLDVDVRGDPAHDDARRHTREMAVTDYVCRFSGGETPPRVHVRVGDVSDEISRFAREVRATTVVLGDGVNAPSSELAMSHGLVATR